MAQRASFPSPRGCIVRTRPRTAPPRLRWSAGAHPPTHPRGRPASTCTARHSRATPSRQAAVPGMLSSVSIYGAFSAPDLLRHSPQLGAFPMAWCWAGPHHRCHGQKSGQPPAEATCCPSAVRVADHGAHSRAKMRPGICCSPCQTEQMSCDPAGLSSRIRLGLLRGPTVAGRRAEQPYLPV